jgi:hypothetical protein
VASSCPAGIPLLQVACCKPAGGCGFQAFGAGACM